MIAVLINDTVERMVILRQVFWLHEILENGFGGFTHWSDEELRRELCGRGFDPGHAIDKAWDGDHDDTNYGDESRLFARNYSANGEFQDHLRDCHDS